jgi:predicted RNase H-like HicB family nuclease
MVTQRTERPALTSTSKPSSHGLQLVQELKDAIAEEEGFAHGSLTHRLPVSGPDGRLAATYTLDLTRDHDGVYLTTCREIPEVFTTADDEDEVLSLARLAILQALIQRQKRLPPTPA